MYFEKQGAHNTQQTVSLALSAARKLVINTVVLPSVTGETALYLDKVVDEDIRVIVITHCNGFKVPGEQEMSCERRKELEGLGMSVYTGTHALSGAERGLSRRYSGISPVEIMAETLRMFGQGTKVAVECAVMALDAGLIGYMKPVVALGGTGRGVDTAIVIRASHAADILSCRVDRIICKPIT